MPHDNRPTRWNPKSSNGHGRLIETNGQFSLSWPASATINYALEGAPGVQGHWLPVQDVTMPGLNQMTVPLADLKRFFRLRQAP